MENQEVGTVSRHMNHLQKTFMVKESLDGSRFGLSEKASGINRNFYELERLVDMPRECYGNYPNTVGFPCILCENMGECSGKVEIPEKCKFEKGGVCTALACYSNEKCAAKDANGNINYSGPCEKCGRYICECDKK